MSKAAVARSVASRTAIAIAMVLFLVPPPTSAQTPTPVGDNFQVNSVTTNLQRRSSLAVRNDGSFVVVWSSEDTDFGDVRGRLFDSGGSPLGPDFLVNTYTTGSQGFFNDVAVASDGSFMVVWSSDESLGDSFDGIQGRFFLSDGSPVGAEIQVNSLTSSAQAWPSVAAGQDNGFVVVWSGETSSGSDSDGYSIQARRFDSSGSPVASDFQINAVTTGDQRAPDITPEADGRFSVVWTSDSSTRDDSDGSSVQWRRLASDGTPQGLGDVQVNTYTTGFQYLAVVDALTDGEFVVSWVSSDSTDDTSVSSIQGQRFRSTAQTLGAQFQVNTATLGRQDDPEILRLPDNGFMVAWESGDFTDPGPDGFDSTISAQRYDSNGFAVGTEFVVNSVAENPQLNPTVGFLGNNRLVFTFDETINEIDARFFALSRIAGRVWDDTSADGIQDGGEAGVEGVTIRLFDDTDTEVDQTITAADGTYGFDIDAGIFYLVFEAPQGFDFTARDVGTDDTVDSEASAEGRTVVLDVVEAELTWDAGLVAQPTADLGDRVWLDTNRNGLQDGGESGFAGVTVELFDAAGVSQGTQVTDGTGAYAFTGLAAGTYYLTFSEPMGFCYTLWDQGADDARDSDVNPDTLSTLLFEVAAGISDSGRDAGLVPDASVGNRVWLDDDGDGLQAGGEVGIANVAVNLFDASDTFLEATVTDPNGFYSFSPGPGTYYLQIVPPTDMALAPRDQGADDSVDSDFFVTTGTTVPFTLAPGAVDMSRDAGLEPAVIGNRVWLDRNADGRQQLDEPGIAGITVRLLDSDDVEVATTTTGGDGIYGFVGIDSSTYRIEVVPPPGSVFSAQDIGVNDLVDSDVDPTTGRSALFPYAAATASRAHDAGLLMVGPVFTDGFESGNTAGWSSVVP